MAGLGDLLGPGSTIEQMFVYNIVGQVLQAVTSPYLTELAGVVNTASPVVPLSAADAATAVNRSFLTDADGQAEAAKQGVDAARFAVMQHLAGNAPAPEELATALRRGLIPADGSGPAAVTFQQGIAEGNLLNKWGPVIQELAKAIPSPADVVDAMVKGQVTAADGATLFELVGGDPKYFQLLVNIAGNPPSPGELLALAQRQVIPWDGTGPDATTFQQGFYEGRSKDKWEPIYRHLAEYYPTASEVVELYRWGELTIAEATGMLTQRGLSAAESARWIAYGDANAVDDYRGLTEQAILAMLSVNYISDDQARTMLAAIHKGPAAIDQLIAYGHVQRAIQSLNQAVSRVGNLYEARKIPASTATDALTRLGIPAAAIAGIIADWDAVASINVKTLTEAQIVDAWAAKVLTDGEAEQELNNIGYTPFDAWVLLSVKAKAPLPDRPAQGPGAPLGAVTPGTT
jgi:hypothetical protein